MEKMKHDACNISYAHCILLYLLRVHGIMSSDIILARMGMLLP